MPVVVAAELDLIRRVLVALAVAVRERKAQTMQQPEQLIEVVAVAVQAATPLLETLVLAALA
jgi:hypothetical protein